MDPEKKGFVPDLYNSTVEYWNIQKEMMEWYRDLFGTEVTISRITEKDKRKNVLSATLTSTFEDEDTRLKFNWKLLINQSTMMPIWRRNTNSIEVIDTIEKMKIGDLVEFEYFGVKYQFKVTACNSYGIGHDIAWQYTLQSIIEHKV